MNYLPMIETNRYTLEDINRLSQIVLGKVKPEDITDIEKKILCALDDTNGSSLREMVTAHAFGFLPRLDNDKYKEDAIDHDGTPINIKPKTVSFTPVYETEFVGNNTIVAGKPKDTESRLSGNSNYNDLKFKLLHEKLKSDLKFIVAGYCGSNLLYGLKFPMLILAEMFISKMKNKSRSIEFGFKNYMPYKDVELLFLRSDIHRYRAVINNGFFDCIQPFSVGNIKTPDKEYILSLIKSKYTDDKAPQTQQEHNYF